jgi:hypothetical protein
METKLLERERRNLERLAWPMRALVLVGAYLLTTRLVWPALPFAAGMAAGGVIAAAAVCAEVACSARLRGQKFSQLAAWRLVMLDHLLSAGKPVARSRPRADAPAAPRRAPVAELGPGEAFEVIDGDAVELDDER